jgi:hypothetical protein
MIRFTILICVLNIFVCLAPAQESGVALIGVTDQNNQHHLYAVSFSILTKVLASNSNVVCRLFIGEVTHSDCPDSKWSGADCFQCGDKSDNVICSHDVVIGYLLGRANDVSPEVLGEAQRYPDKFPEWKAIKDELVKEPKLITELKPDSDAAKKFWSVMSGK